MTRVISAPVDALKATTQGILRRWGYELHRTSRRWGGPDYERVIPAATYAPWNVDRLFQETFSAIAGHTLVDQYRCFELWSLVEQSRKLRGSLIEVGVWRGGTGALLARRAKLCGIKDTVYLCDTFTGVPKAGDEDSSYRGGEHADTSAQVVQNLIHRLQLDNTKIVAGMFPEETFHLIEASEFRLCHIDVDVYQSAKDIMEWMWDKMVVGGIVVYDDYGFRTCAGIKKHVEEQRALGDRLVLHNLNGHAVIVKTG